MKKTQFERAIFLSWYCAKGDCKFCYMSTQKNLIKDPKKARRSFASILAEAIICKKIGWKIEFLSGGYESFTKEELLFLIKNIYKIYGEKLWLNIGILSKKDLKLFKPYIEGVCGTIETINPKLHKEICPSKPIKPVENMFKYCDEFNIKKSITIIIGVGETLKDFSLLKEFIKKNKIDKITFYRLKPQKGTFFEGKKEPSIDYYVEWVKKTRKEFPKLHITVGSWLTHLDEIHLLLEAGADNITKFPSIKLFNSKYAKKIEEEVKKANRKFIGTLTKLPEINIKKEINKLELDEKLKKEVKVRLERYLERMKKPLYI